MTILSTDIALIESERMTDTPDGGGRRTARVIPDGGQVFPKVSRLDTVYGRVNLRKIYGAVRTQTRDVYAGAHMVVTDPADDGRISTLLFSTGSDFDQRLVAQDRIEAYVVAGPESRMKLYGRQPIGAKAVLTYQRMEEPLPEIGDVYCLTQDSTVGVQVASQYIRIDGMTHEKRTFTDDSGTYDYRIITLGITSQLTYAFSGPDTPPRSSSVARLGKVATTSVADAARYYGVKPLSEAAAAGSLSVRVADVYAPLVPTTQREAAISLAEVSGALNHLESGGTTSASITSVSAAQPIYFPRGLMPTSISVGSYGRDDGKGTISLPSISSSAAIQVDYESGTLTPNFTGALVATITAAHGVQTGQAAHTYDVPITLSNRGSLYAVPLSPPPAPKTLIVDYRALGKWYRLRDEQGNGTLAGSDASWGSATVDYATGGVVVTLGALPDVESSLLLSWGSGAHYVRRAGASQDVAGVYQTITLPDHPVAAGSCSLTYIYGGSPVTLSITGDSASNANIQAAVDPHAGVLKVRHIGVLPDPGSVISVSYGRLTASGGSPAPVEESDNVNMFGLTSIELGKSVVAGSVRVLLPMIGMATGEAMWPWGGYKSVVACYDDGAGSLRVSKGQQLIGVAPGQPPAAVEADAVVGAINYATGSIGINNGVPITGHRWVYPLGSRPGEWVPSAATAGRNGAQSSPAVTAAVTYRPASATTASTATTSELSWSAAPLLVDLTSTTAQSIVSGSVALRLGQSDGSNVNLYCDRGGSLVRNHQPATGAAASAGRIDYLTGIASITDWPSANRQATVQVESCLSYHGEFTAERIRFRTAGSPVRYGSLYVRVTTSGGDQLSGASNVSGNITGTLMQGTINQDMGVVSLRFGEWQPVAGNSGADWFEAANIDPSDASRVWKPTLVLTSTLRYSCVVTSSVALDSAILGLDPVRLPLDGRVPVYRPGGVVVVHNTQTQTLANPVVAGATYALSRSALQDAWLVGADNIQVPPSYYSTDLAAGTITMAASLAGLSSPQPLSARHRVEDMALVSDVSIDGTVTLASPLSRAYDTSSYISSALLIGDTYARVHSVFDQASWLGAWVDSVDGEPANAEYNAVLYPIEVTNAGAITERWRLQFTSSTSFQCYGQSSGLIATGSTSADFAPINPLTSEPYFVVRSSGWGAGWAVGNNLRFNSVSAAAPVWAIRTILPGAALTGDSVDIQFRGDADAA